VLASWARRIVAIALRVALGRIRPRCAAPVARDRGWRGGSRRVRPRAWRRGWLRHRRRRALDAISRRHVNALPVLGGFRALLESALRHWACERVVLVWVRLVDQDTLLVKLGVVHLGQRARDRVTGERHPWCREGVLLAMRAEYACRSITRGSGKYLSARSTLPQTRGWCRACCWHPCRS
jgi:hypothetical protein